MTYQSYTVSLDSVTIQQCHLSVFRAVYRGFCVSARVDLISASVDFNNPVYGTRDDFVFCVSTDIYLKSSVTSIARDFAFCIF